MPLDAPSFCIVPYRSRTALTPTVFLYRLAWMTTLPPKIGRGSYATQSTPPSREAWVCRVSSPIFWKRLVMSDSKSRGDSSMRFGRWSRSLRTSLSWMKRGIDHVELENRPDRHQLGRAL